MKVNGSIGILTVTINGSVGILRVKVNGSIGILTVKVNASIGILTVTINDSVGILTVNVNGSVGILTQICGGGGGGGFTLTWAIMLWVLYPLHRLVQVTRPATDIWLCMHGLFISLQLALDKGQDTGHADWYKSMKWIHNTAPPPP